MNEECYNNLVGKLNELQTRVNTPSKSVLCPHNFFSVYLKDVGSDGAVILPKGKLFKINATSEYKDGLLHISFVQESTTITQEYKLKVGMNTFDSNMQLDEFTLVRVTMSCPTLNNSTTVCFSLQIKDFTKVKEIEE